MSTTLNKLEYLDETKSQIKNALNTNFDAEITEEDTFRSYVSKINTIYSNWPRVTGEDTTLSLTPTKKGLMALSLKGNTYQKTTTGKNLLQLWPNYNVPDLTITKNSQSSLLVNGTISTIKYADAAIMNNINIPSGTYTLSIKDNNGNHYGGDIYINGTYYYKNVVDKTLEINDTITSIKVVLYISARTYDNTTIYFQFESGSTSSSWEEYTGGIASPNPDYPQDIHVVSGDNTLKVEGKNLFDKDGINFDGHTGINNFNGKQIASNTFVGFSCYNLVSNNGRCQAYFKGIIGETYYLSFNSKYKIRTIKAFGSDGIITATLPTQNKITMTTNYIGITLGKTDETDFTDAEVLELKNSMQIEKGSTATTYEPYQSQTYPINLGTMGLCKTPTYEDYFHKDNGKWYKHGEIGNVVFDGSESGWWLQSGIQFRIALSNSKAYGSISSNYFIGSENTTDGNMLIYSTGYLRVYRNCNSLEDFITWLSTHNTEVYYVLDTPVETEITDTTLIAQLEAIAKAISYDNQTNISQTNDDMPFIISASALKKGGN